MFKYHTFRPRRTIPLAIVLIVLGFGVLLFTQNQDAIDNFHSYYLTSYKTALAYRFSTHANPAADSGYAKSVPVLLYHGIVADNADTTNIEGYSLPVSSFADQMKALKTAGYHTISINDYYDFIYHSKHLPKKSFLLTFDDGRKDSYYPVQPVLQALGFRATMFVITGHSLSQEKSDFYLSKSELLSMKASGSWDLQAHTRDGHKMFLTGSDASAPFFANKLWLKGQNRLETNDEYRTRIQNDLENAKSDIVKYLGISPVAWAIPFSDLGENTTNYPDAKKVLLGVATKIYPLIFRQYTVGLPYAENYLGSGQALNVRIEPKPGWTSSFLLQTIHQSDAKELPYKATLGQSDGWLTPWGKSSMLPGGLHLQALSNTNGATVNLDGSDSWSDYVAKATVRLAKGSNVRLLMRLQDPHHNLQCSYTDSSMRLELVVDDKSKLLKETKVKLDLKQSTMIKATVKGDTAKCTAPSGATVTAQIPDLDLIHTGGIGLVVYDSTANNAEGIVTNLEVTMAQ